MTAKNKRAAKPAGKGPAVQAEPTFYREQLTAALEYTRTSYGRCWKKAGSTLCPRQKKLSTDT